VVEGFGKEGSQKKDRKKIGGDIKTVELEWPIGMPVCRPMGQGLFEVRTDGSPTESHYTGMFYIDKKGRMVLLHSFE
jgi:phage-related protein